MNHIFLIDTNLPLDLENKEIASVLELFSVGIDGSTDLDYIGREVRAHKPDIAYIPSADWHRSLRKGDRHYRGLVMPTSKFSGTTELPSVLVVRKDDPAKDLVDLEGASYGFINTSCTSSYFPPMLMLHKRGIRFDRFLDGKPVKPWQGQIDAVVGGEVRATMTAEDIWRTDPRNAETTKIIGRYDPARPAVIVARHDLDRKLRSALTEAIVDWVPPWSSIYGPFKPFLYADVNYLFHELDGLPADS